MGLLIDDLLAYLASEADLEVGEDLFSGQLPEDLELGTVLRHTGGPARPYGPRETVTFQALTRGATFAAAHARARSIYDAIYPEGDDRFPVRNQDLSAEWRALAIDAIQPPTDLGLSDAGQHLVVFNLAVRAVHLHTD